MASPLIFTMDGGGLPIRTCHAQISSMKTDMLQNPGVRFPPPTLFVLGIGCGWLLNRIAPLPIGLVLATPIRLAAGWGIVVVGVALLAWAMSTFLRARTAIYPTQPARQIVGNGPYRFSRNPMYLGLALMMTGIGLVANNIWILMLVPVILFAVTKLVIRREEAYLSQAFGESYVRYQGHVRRWL